MADTEKNYFIFSIKLSSENRTENVSYFGNLFLLDIKQIKRFVQVKQEFSKFTGQIHRSKVIDTRVSVVPNILITNPLPLELKLKLIDTELNAQKDLLQSKYLKISPTKLESWIDNSFFTKPNEIQLVLSKSLEEENKTAEWTTFKFKLRLYTADNQFINPLLETLDTLI